MRVSGITANHVHRPCVVLLPILVIANLLHPNPAVTIPAVEMRRVRVRIRMIKERARAKKRMVANPVGKVARPLTSQICHVFKRLSRPAVVPTVQIASIATIPPCSDPFVQWLHSPRVRVLLLFPRLTLELVIHLLSLSEVVEVLAVWQRLLQKLQQE